MGAGATAANSPQLAAESEIHREFAGNPQKQTRPFLPRSGKKEVLLGRAEIRLPVASGREEEVPQVLPPRIESA
jgi:hypothetical protein